MKNKQVREWRTKERKDEQFKYSKSTESYTWPQRCRFFIEDGVDGDDELFTNYIRPDVQVKESNSKELLKNCDNNF